MLFAELPLLRSCYPVRRLLAATLVWARLVDEVKHPVLGMVPTVVLPLVGPRHAK